MTKPDMTEIHACCIHPSDYEEGPETTNHACCEHNVVSPTPGREKVTTKDWLTKRIEQRAGNPSFEAERLALRDAEIAFLQSRLSAQEKVIEKMRGLCEAARDVIRQLGGVMEADLLAEQLAEMETER